MKNTYLATHPAPDLRVEDRHKVPDHEKQDAFSSEDLKRMFCDSPEFGDDKTLEAHHFWIPLIALFSGARLEEICQAYISDLKQVGSIWCLDVQEEALRSEKSVKMSEKRLVLFASVYCEGLELCRFRCRFEGSKRKDFSKAQMDEVWQQVRWCLWTMVLKVSEEMYTWC